MENQMIVEKAFKRGRTFFIENKVSLITSFVVGVLTYMFAFTNKLLNHDEIGELFSKGAGLSSGRWGLNLASYIFPDYSMPWIYGIISIILIALSSCYIIKIFEIRNKFFQGVLSALIVSFPSLIGTFGYMFTASSYALSFFLAVLSVWLFTRKSVLEKFIALTVFVLSISIYQSYIAIASTLFLLYLVRRLIYEDVGSLEILKQGVLFIAFLGISCALYYAITQIMLLVTNVEFNSYASDNLSFGSIPGRILAAYDSFINIFFGKYNLVPTFLSQVLHVLCISTALILFIIIPKKPAQKVLLFILIALLPLSINSMFIITSDVAIHTLVLYSFIGVYIYEIIVFDYALDQSAINILKIKVRQMMCDAAAVIMSITVIINVFIGNEAYLRLFLQYENAYSLYTSVMTQVEMTPGFGSDTKIALIGTAGNLIHRFGYEFSDIKDLAGTNTLLANSITRNMFIKYYIGMDVNFASLDDIENIKSTSEFKQMPIYPYYGSISRIDDCIVVKFSYD